MRIYYMSDTHHDCNGNVLERLRGDKDAVLVVAGDIHSKGRMTQELDNIANRWKAIVAVPGNHDWWGLALHETHKFQPQFNNVHILNDDHVIIDGVLFVGSTHWTDAGTDPLENLDWQFTMNDAKKIRGNNYRRLDIKDLSFANAQSYRYISECKDIQPESGIKILVTHHGIDKRSLDPKYGDAKSNKYYVSGHSELLDGYNVHIHGHIHYEHDYMTESGCNVVCNPHGYFSENPNFGIRIIETAEL